MEITHTPERNFTLKLSEKELHTLFTIVEIEVNQGDLQLNNVERMAQNTARKIEEYLRENKLYPIKDEFIEEDYSYSSENI